MLNVVQISFLTIGVYVSLQKTPPPLIFPRIHVFLVGTDARNHSEAMLNVAYISFLTIEGHVSLSKTTPPPLIFRRIHLF